MQQVFEFPVEPHQTFDSFIDCEGNSAPLQFARRIADPSEAENLLYLYGPAGSGKTHLLKAISCRLSRLDYRAPYLSCRDLAAPQQLFSLFSGASVLLLDDLHLLSDNSALRGAIWQIFNEFYSSGRKIAMSGNLPPRELPHLDDHLVSRLLWGLVSRIDISDDGSRRMILKKVADDRQVRVPDDVVEYILATTSREAGALISAFEQLYRLSLSEKRRISLALARQLRASATVPITI